MATMYDQQATTYSDTTPHVRVISEIMQFIDPTDTPLLDALGGLDAGRSRFRVRENGYKVELLEDEYSPLSSTLNHGAAVTTNTLVITVTDASILQPGHVILIDSEYLVVSSISGEAVTVHSRSYGGTNATHDTSAAFSIVGMARLEGDDADYIGLVDVSAPYNYTQIFQKGLNISGSLQAIDQYAITDHFGYQAAKAIPELLRLVELGLFHGIRAAGTASTPRSFGGLGTFITDNSVNAGGGIAKSDVDNLLEAIYADGGNPDLFVCNPAVANDIKALIDSSSFVRVDQANQQFGMSPINRVVTQYGSLRLVMSRFCPVAKAFVIDSRKMGLYTLRPFAWKQLGDTGDSKKGEVVAELSFLVANDKAHGWIYGLTS